jgi:hypothetical protein
MSQSFLTIRLKKMMHQYRSTQYTEEDKALVDELIKPVFARLQIEGDDEANERIWNDLFFSAMRGVRENRSCEA